MANDTMEGSSNSDLKFIHDPPVSSSCKGPSRLPSLPRIETSSPTQSGLMTFQSSHGYSLPPPEMSASNFINLDCLDPSRNPRYKTEICRNFKERSKCIYGDQFAHGRRELRDVVRNSKYKTKLCQKYWVAGYCAYGPRCNFLHDEDKNMSRIAIAEYGLNGGQAKESRHDSDSGKGPSPVNVIDVENMTSLDQMGSSKSNSFLSKYRYEPFLPISIRQNPSILSPIADVEFEIDPSSMKKKPL